MALYFQFLSDPLLLHLWFCSKSLFISFYFHFFSPFNFFSIFLFLFLYFSFVIYILWTFCFTCFPRFLHFTSFNCSLIIPAKTLRRFYFGTLEVRFIFLLTFRKLNLAINLKYLSYFFINFNNQWQLWNPHDEKSVPDLWIWWRIDWDDWHWKRWRQY